MPSLKSCSCQNCFKPLLAKGYCNMHYSRLRRHGSLDFVKYNRNPLGSVSVYNSWVGMKARCYNKNSKKFPRYGERGIKVCDRWKNSFENFYIDMGERPSAQHSLDRIDNNGDYTPDNCKWSTPTEQARNRHTNRLITITGKTQHLSDWLIEKSVPRSTYYRKIRLGFSSVEIFS